MSLADRLNHFRFVASACGAQAMPTQSPLIEPDFDTAFSDEDEALARERAILSLCTESEDGEHTFHLGWCLHCNSEEPG